MEEHSELSWIVGSEKAAARHTDGRIWTVIDKNEGDKSLSVQSVHRDFSFGVYFNLNRSRKQLARDPASSRSPLLVSTSLPKLSTWFALLGLFVLASLGGTGHFVAGELSANPNFAFPEDFFDFIIVALVAVGSWMSFLGWEGGVLAGKFNTGARILGFGLRGPAVEHVVWRLGRLAPQAWIIIALPALSVWCIWSWHAVLGPVAIGILLGAWAYLIPALFPLKPGPGSSILESLAGIRDLPSTLRWSLATRFLPAGQKISTGSGWLMILMVLALVGWVALVSESFKILGGMVPSNGLVSIFWEPVFILAYLGFLLWLIGTGVQIYCTAWQLRGKGKPQAANPSEADRQSFMEHNALLHHLPELKNLNWDWLHAPAGTYLIEHGQHDRYFYWFGSGEARIFGRTADGDVVHWANINKGSGVGEIALLEDVTRTADVFLTRSSVICRLSHKEFQKVETPELRERFGELVRTGQAFDRSRIFRRIPSTDKERWLNSGAPLRCEDGEPAIEQGSTARWMGLVVSGQLLVEKDGKTIAQLGAGDIFGEMAFLTMEKRSASLRARGKVLIWKWEASFLDDRVDALGIRDSLTKMAEGRQSIQGGE